MAPSGVVGDGGPMLFAEAVTLSGEVVALFLLAALLVLLAAATVVVGTLFAARRFGRTGSVGAGAVAAFGVSCELALLVGMLSSGDLGFATVVTGIIGLDAVMFDAGRRAARP